MTTRPALALALAVLAVTAQPAQADNPKPRQADPATDADLLEFLGSVDTAGGSQAAADDGSWLEYLSQTDISKVARTNNPRPNNPDAAQPRQPAPATTPPVPSGEQKDD